MDSKIPASVQIEEPDVYIVDYPDESMTQNVSQIPDGAVDKAMRLAKVLGGKGYDDNTGDEVNNLIDIPLTYEDLLELTKSASEDEEATDNEEEEEVTDSEEEEEATGSEEEEEATDPACETDSVQSSTGKVISEDPVFDKMDSKIQSVKTEQPEVYIDYADESMKNMESHSLLPSKNIKLEPACETDNVQSSTGEVISEDKVFDKMDCKIPANVKIEQPDVYVDYTAELMKSMESRGLLPSNKIKLEPACEVRPSDNIKLEPACETDNVQSSNGEVISEDQVFDKMNSKIPASVKIEQPYVYMDYADESMKSMESHSLLPSNKIKLEPVCEVRPRDNIKLEPVCEVRSSDNIKLEPACETDNVQSSTGENISEDQVFDKMNSKIPSVMIIQPDMYIVDYPDESMKIHLFSESYPSRQEQTKTEKMVYGNIDRTLGKRGQPDVLCKGKSHKFSKMLDTFLHTQKTTDAGENPYKCYICCSSFSIVSHLKRHMRAHTGERLYKCDICRSSFTYSSDLNYHVRIHTGEKPYKCDICGASFTFFCQLKHHLRTHIGEKPFKCDICSISFSGAKILKRHMGTHTGEKPYKCDICTATFTQAGNLKCHMRTHTGEKPYKCGVCGVSFTSIFGLRNHLKIHTEEKLYKCSICGVSFTSTSGLKYHARTHTVKKPY